MNCYLVVASVLFSQSLPASLVPFGDRQPTRTLFRGYVVRTVEQEAVQRELGLSEDQKTYLQTFLKLVSQKEHQVFSVLPANHGDEKWQKVVGDSEARHAGFHKDLEEVLGSQKWRRLNEIALQLWGLRVMLYPHLDRVLSLTLPQREKAKEILAKYEGEIVSVSLQVPGWRVVYAAPLERERDQQLLQILDEQQRAKWKTLQGMPTKVMLRPTPPLATVESSHVERRKQLLRAAETLQARYPLIELVRVPEVGKELQLHASDQQKLDRFVQGYIAEEKKRGGSLANFQPSDFRAREQFTIVTAAAITDAEKNLRTLLPAEKFHRLWQIQRQLRGVGMVFGFAGANTYGISKEDNARLDQRINEIMNEFHGHLTAAKSDDERHQLGIKLNAALAQAMWEILHPDQKKKWQAEIGKPIDEALKLAVKRYFERIPTSVKVPYRFPIDSLPSPASDVPEFSCHPMFSRGFAS